MFIDYWYNNISDIANKISRSQGSRFTEFPLYMENTPSPPPPPPPQKKKKKKKKTSELGWTGLKLKENDVII